MHFRYMGVLESSMINYSPGNLSSAGTSTRHSPLLIRMTVRFQWDPRGHSSDDYVRQIMPNDASCDLAVPVLTCNLKALNPPI